MRPSQRIVSRLTKALGFLGSILVILLVLHVAADVVMRNVFGAPLTGTIEIVSMIYMIGICFLPLALAEERDAHISVEVVTNMMPRRAVRVLTILGTLITIVALTALCWRTWLEAMAQMRKGAVMIVAGSDPMLTWPSYFLLPVGFGLALCVCLYKLFCLLTKRPFGPEADDVPAGMELLDKGISDNV